MGIHVVVFVETIVILKGRTTGKKYRKDLVDRIHPMIESLFLAINEILWDKNASIHTVKLLQSWFYENKDEGQHLS